MKALCAVALFLLCLIQIQFINCQESDDFLTAVASSSVLSTEILHKRIQDWEAAMSGKPINCRRLADLFLEEGRWSFPAGKGVEKQARGQRNIFALCERRLESEFSHIETFISGPVYYSGNTVSLHRTFLGTVLNSPCKVTLHGHSLLHYTSQNNTESGEPDILLLEWQDYWNVEQYKTQINQCSFDSPVDPTPLDLDAYSHLF